MVRSVIVAVLGTAGVLWGLEEIGGWRSVRESPIARAMSSLSDAADADAPLIQQKEWAGR